MRGKITNIIKKKSIELFGYELTQTELRILPYIQYTMMNNQKLDPNKINQAERDILSTWREKNWIEGGASGLSITKEFWNYMNEILWLGYVDYE